jgi:outer membrane lipoprotein-sorting protein
MKPLASMSAAVRTSKPVAVRQNGVRPDLMRLAGRTVITAMVLIAPLSAQSLSAVYARLDKTAPQFKSVMADIKSVVHTAIVNDDTNETGSIKVRHDKAGDTKMIIDFMGADAKTVSFDGTSVNVYYPKIKTVQVYAAADKKGLIDQFLLLGFGASSAELQSAYDVSWIGSENIEGKPTGHIQLIPKSKEVLQRLKWAELWISMDTGLPAQQKFTTSTSGDYRQVTYLNLKLNSGVSDNSLKLNLPKGVKTEHPQI